MRARARIMRFARSAVAAAAVLLGTHAARAAEAAALSITDVLHRVDTLDPRLRERLMNQAISEVDLRRAEWNRVSGSVGVTAATFGQASPLATAEPASIGRIDLAGIGAQLRVPLYAGGAIHGAIDAARARLRASRFSSESVRLELKTIALKGYADVVAKELGLRASEEAAERARALAALAEDRLAAGLGTEVEVLRAKANQSQREEAVEIARGALHVAEASLRASVMAERPEALRLTSSLDDIEALEPKSRARRPDIEEARALVAAAEQEQRVARAGYLPRIDLVGNAQYALGGTLNPPLSSFGPLLDGSTSFSGAVMGGLQATWTGFDFFVTRDRVARAAAETRRLAALQEDVERRARSERERERALEAQAKKRTELLRAASELAARAEQLEMERYKTGSATMTDVLNAQSDAIEIRLREVLARYELAAAHVERLRAEGCQW